MTTIRPRPTRRLMLLPIAVSVALAACGTSGGATAGPTAVISPTVAAPPASASQPPDAGTAVGDVPDNAVFLTYRAPDLGFEIQYVEGWQVTPAADGVSIRDKDSSEDVHVVAGTDVLAYIAATDLPALRAQPGFTLVVQDTLATGDRRIDHLTYHLPAPPDPVTGKQVPSTVDRFYVSGPAGIAVVTLSTPDGVDNVDAFRQMIESFRWA
ncbi:MAG: hypothetical protein ACSLFN_00515 [Candidatus Limnocylindrales bacterium]